MVDGTQSPGEDQPEPGVRVEGRFAIVPEALLLDASISAHAVRLYGVLVRYGSSPETCFPSYSTLGDALGASARSVPKWARELEAAGWILRHFSPEGETNGYTVRTHRDGPPGPGLPRNDPNPRRPTRRDGPSPYAPGGAGRAAPEDAEGSAPASAPRARPTARQKRASEREPRNESPPTPPVAQVAMWDASSPPAVPEPARTYASGRGHDAMFETFWTAYPRKVGKIAARKAWAAALRQAPDSTIVAGARRYAEDPNRDPEYTCHPTTWLNQGRWDDGPLPARASRSNRTEQAIARMAGGRAVPRPDLASVFGQQPAARSLGA